MDQIKDLRQYRKPRLGNTMRLPIGIKRPLFLLLSGFVIVLVAYVGSLFWSDSGVADEFDDDAAFESISGTGQTLTIEDINLSITFWQQRIQSAPNDMFAHFTLGGYFVQKARHTGDIAQYDYAEEALRRAVELVPLYGATRVQLGAVLLAKHQFAEALDLAEVALKQRPDEVSALSVIGDANLALGNYSEAEVAFSKLMVVYPGPGATSRSAALEFLLGRTDTAIMIMRKAVDSATLAGGFQEEVAWYAYRLGDLYRISGQYQEAIDQFSAALEVFHDYRLALLGMGKARAAQGRYRDAIALVERAAEIIPELNTLVTLGDLYTLIGDQEPARQAYDTVEVIARLSKANQVIYNRSLALFYADHDLKLDTALELAETEIEVRKDIYGYDTLAWVLYKHGRFDEATDAITKAMRLGTQDAQLYFHAGMIYYRLGRNDEAGEFLEHALRISPRFSIQYTEDANLVLNKLRQQSAPATSANRSGP